MKYVFVLILVVLVQGCTGDTDKVLPDMGTYEKDGALMVNICQKFADEPDGKKLNKAAVAVQAARVISCANFNEECNIYGRCLTQSIDASKDGDISARDRAELKKTVSDLKAALSEGKTKLEAAWKKKHEKQD